MDVTIHIDPADEPRVRERAAAAGKDVAAFVAEVALKAITAPTLDEMLAPVREQFARSGMTDDELGDFLEDVKHDMRREKRAGS